MRAEGPTEQTGLAVRDRLRLRSDAVGCSTPRAWPVWKKRGRLMDGEGDMDRTGIESIIRENGYEDFNRRP